MKIPIDKPNRKASANPNINKMKSIVRESRDSSPGKFDATGAYSNARYL